MYQLYDLDDYLKVVDECTERICAILQARLSELKERRDAINDRYPFVDLYLQQEAVDSEEAIIGDLLKHLEHCADVRKAKLRTYFLEQ